MSETPEQDVQEPVPVADQKAAGVPPEETVTIADQKAGVPPPPQVQQGAQPDTAFGQPPSPDPSPTDQVQSAANESPVMPANAQAAAAKAHAYLGHVIQVLQQAQSEVEKFVPAELIGSAERDVKAFVQGIL